MAHPTRVTFPGTVRFAPPAPKDAKGKPLRLVLNHDEKGAFKSTTLTCPEGKRFAYEVADAPESTGTPPPPTFIVHLEDEIMHEPVHAELEHVAATDTDVAHVVARSTKHTVDGKPLSAVGATAADAVKFLRMAVADHEAKTTAADDDAKKKGDDARDAADVAAELHNSTPPPALRHG